MDMQKRLKWELKNEGFICLIQKLKKNMIKFWEKLKFIIYVQFITY